MNSNQPDPILSSEDGVQRRTIVAGAAWTIPVIATAVGAPLAAASGETPTLAFTAPSYTVDSCGRLTGVQVKKTTDGSTPAENESITVTLANGYTFSGGGTTYTGQTNGAGIVALPTITGAGNASTMQALSGTLSASASLTPVTIGAGIAKGAYNDTNPSTQYAVAGIPASARPLDGAGIYWLSGSTIYQRGGNVITTTATNVIGDFEHWGSGNQARVAWMDEAGIAHQAYNSTDPSTVVAISGIPAGARPLDGAGVYWISGTTIYQAGGNVITTTATTAIGDFNHWGTGNQARVAWMDQAGIAHQAYNSTNPSTVVAISGIPAGARPLDGAGIYWLSGTTIYQAGGNVITTTATNVIGDFEHWGSGNQARVAWMDEAGIAHQAYNSTDPSTVVAISGIPAGARPLDGAGVYWISGTTIYQAGGNVLATTAGAVIGDFNHWGVGNQARVAWMDQSACA